METQAPDAIDLLGRIGVFETLGPEEMVERLPTVRRT
jgi:hypothetical protein